MTRPTSSVSLAARPGSPQPSSPGGSSSGRGPFRRGVLACLVGTLLALTGPALAPVAVAAPLAATATATATAPADAALVAGGTTYAAADEPVEWSVAPADAHGPDEPDGRVSLRSALDPGQTAHDAIAVTNLSTTEHEFTVTAGDGVVGPGGAFDVRSGEPVDSGSWIDVDGVEDGRLTLAGGETRVLPVSVEVPQEATPGDHPAGIVVAVSTAEDGVRVTHRVGVRWHLQVTGELTPALAVQDVRASYTPSWIPFAPGTLHVDYVVMNAGNVRLGANARVDAAGPAELAGAEASQDVGELLPGDSASRSVELSAWPLFSLSGDVQVSALSIGDDAVALPASVQAGFGVLAVPWTGLVALLAVVALAVALRHRRRAAAAAMLA